MAPSFLFITNSGESLPIAWRLLLHGNHADIYIHHPRYRKNYDGLMQKTKIGGLLKAVRRADVVVIDLVRENVRKPHDRAILKLFKQSTTEPEVFGSVADAIRKRYPDKIVIGPSKETAAWEMDRFLGSSIAEKVGLNVPEYERFYSLTEGAKFLNGRRDTWVFKPLNNADLDLTYVEKFPGELHSKLTGEYRERLGDKADYILQRVVKGDEISTEAWFDGVDFLYFNHTIEDKRMMNSNLGLSIGSQSNTVWLKKNPNGLLSEQFDALRDIIKGTGHVGPIDVNCIVDKKGRPWFLEWSVRCGWDALYCLLSLVKNGIESLFQFKAEFYDGFASSQRLTIPPFPYSHEDLLDNMAKGVEIRKGFEFPEFWAEDVQAKNGKIVCAGADGIIGVVAARGNSLGGSVGNVYRAIDRMQVASYLQYRTDLGKRAKAVMDRLKANGVAYE